MIPGFWICICCFTFQCQKTYWGNIFLFLPSCVSGVLFSGHSIASLVPRLGRCLSVSPSSLTSSHRHFSSHDFSHHHSPNTFPRSVPSWLKATGCVLFQSEEMFPLPQLFTPFSVPCQRPEILPFIISFPHPSQCQEYSHYLLNGYLTEN